VRVYTDSQTGSAKFAAASTVAEQFVAHETEIQVKNQVKVSDWREGSCVQPIILPVGVNTKKAGYSLGRPRERSSTLSRAPTKNPATG
jgi:hypothetical protein